MGPSIKRILEQREAITDFVAELAKDKKPKGCQLQDSVYDA